MPVEASVAEIFRATSPALPMPVTTTLPVQPSISRTARPNESPMPSAAFRIALPSARRISRPCASTSASVGTAEIAGLAMVEEDYRTTRQPTAINLFLPCIH